MCHTDKSCTFQNGGVQSEHALLNEGSCGISTEWGLGSRRFLSDSGSEENIVDSGVEFVPEDLKEDSSDNDNDIFIFIIGIHATRRIKLFKNLCLDSFCFAVAIEKGMRYDCMDYLSDKCTS